VLVQLYDAANGTVIASTRSNNLGVYSFDSMTNVLEPARVRRRRRPHAVGARRPAADCGRCGGGGGRRRSRLGRPLALDDARVAAVLATAGADAPWWRR
jgi:hypothetical protein